MWVWGLAIRGWGCGDRLDARWNAKLVELLNRKLLVASPERRFVRGVSSFFLIGKLQLAQAAPVGLQLESRNLDQQAWPDKVIQGRSGVMRFGTLKCRTRAAASMININSWK